MSNNKIRKVRARKNIPCLKGKRNFLIDPNV